MTNTYYIGLDVHKETIANADATGPMRPVEPETMPFTTGQVAAACLPMKEPCPNPPAARFNAAV